VHSPYQVLDLKVGEVSADDYEFNFAFTLYD
jgi:hypothetical protein